MASNLTTTPTLKKDPAKIADSLMGSGAVTTPQPTVPEAPEAPQLDTVDSSSLTTERDITVPETPAQTGVTGELAKFEAQTDEYTKGLEARTKSAEAEKETATKDYIASLLRPGEIAQTTKQYERKGGVDDIQVELDDINSQIRAEQHSLRRRLEAIDPSGAGSRLGAEGEKRLIERESLRTQADLSVIQMAIQGRYDSAKTIADRAVSAQVEADKAEQEVRKTVYQDNKDLFTKAEQREFEAKQADRDRQIKSQEEMQKNLYDLAIKAVESGAGTSVAQQIMGAKTLAQAIPLAVAYLGPKGTTEKPTLQNFGTADAPNWKQYDPKTGMWGDVSGLDGGRTVTSPSVVAKSTQQVKDIVSAKGDGLKSAVGPNPFARMSPGEAFNAQRSNFVATVGTVVADLVVGNLIQKKSEGATFGALNEQEFGVIKDSATKINQWAIMGRKGTPDEGKIIGYKTTESAFKEEWDKITYFSTLDALLKGANPEEIGVDVTDDGKYWMADSFGNMVEINGVQ